MSEINDPPPLKFSRVYREEQKEITTRRERQFYAREKDPDSSQDCVGLALSGGGIRSATFCLGFLQELNQLKLLRVFDYLSTVSGGGYVGGWWSAWLSRDEEVMRRKRNPRVDQKNIHHAASLVARIAGGEDEMSLELLEQIRLENKQTYRLLKEYTAGEQPDPALLKELVGQLNTYIENGSDEASRLLEMVTAEPELEATLTATQKADLESARDWKDGSRLVEEVTTNPELEATLQAAQKVKLEEARRRIEGVRLLAEVTADPKRETTLTAAEKADLEKARCRENDRRWGNRFRLEKAFPYELRNNFPPREMIEPMRRNPDSEENSEGSQHAYRDPIHHLRLFANYLTPRKGMLSADTWRAVSVITRNLVLTWLILLPVLIAVMLLGQAYLRLGKPLALMFDPDPTHAIRILTVAPIVVMLSWSVVVAIGWLICNRESTSKLDGLVQLACLLALFLLLGSAVLSIDKLEAFIRSLQGRSWIALGVWGATTLVLTIFLWFGGPRYEKVGVDESQWKKDVRRNRFSRAQARLLVTTAVIGIVLFMSWTCTTTPLLTNLTSPLKSIPFGIVSLISIAGSIFTALRAKPTAGGDRAASREPTFISRTIFAVTPPLVLLVLATSAGFVANWVLDRIANTPPEPTPYLLSVAAQMLNTLIISPRQTPYLLSVAALLFIILCAALAAFEMKDFKSFKILEPSLTAALFIAAVVVNASWFVQALVYSPLPASLKVSGEGWLGILSFLGSMAIAVIIIVYILARIIPGQLWKGRLVQRLEVAGREMEGSSASRSRAAARGVEAYLNLTIGLIVLAALAAVGWSVGTVLFKATSGNGSVTPNIFSALILSFVSITGGAIMYRLCLVRDTTNPGKFNLRWLKDKPFAKRPEAPWVLAALCLIVPVGFVCLSHYLGRQHDDATRLDIVLFPLTLAALLGVVIFLRSLVIERIANDKSIAARWSKPLVEWAFTRLPRAQKYEQQVLRVLAFLVILLSIFAHPVSHNIAPFSMASAGGVNLTNLGLLAIVLVIVWPIFGAAIFRLRPNPTLNVGFTFKRWHWLYSETFLWTLALAAIVLALSAGVLVKPWLNHISDVPLNGGLTPILLPGAAACFLFVLFEMFWAKGENRRSLWLVTLTFVAFATIFFLNLAKTTHPETVSSWQVVLGLLSAVTVWVVALGWMVDPNAVSMHQFYKGRLVRAYLGASNVRRWRHGNKEITETVAGDDLLLKSMHNCDRGGPYHLINTTLNLVGGRDLATAQRSASSFTLSQKHCGSTRTHYRPTDEYMSGQLSLGTAVAASGAAVSPNMGSKKPTAALAMLMTLLNVRLGYWAPTPNRETWQSSQPRLWPFYLLREFLSQTNDVANYCYLTDGGHFDNTGLYPLIERGCRYIVLVDCGADPKPACFQDLGEAIRRCRIDFGAEIDLSLDFLLEKETNRCFMFGSIRFSREHLKALGKWPRDADDGDDGDPSLDGTIIYIKPAVVPSVTADVRQYSLENEFFPQQTTANQWFDEAQFESYRRLGQFCANKVFNTGAVRDLGKVVRLSAQNIETLFIGLESASRK
ncbi:MAG TPA: patatin-like phospholipase family protein [Pyrinomonadaceae bacterium]|nr:patatin-like phospholipase family protein [Pyrinomonadaceae bacterium]